MQFILFHNIESPFSNMFHAEFRLWRRNFYSSEQAYMYAKAMSMHDQQIADAILRTKDPYEAKKLGNLIAHFNQTKWDSMRVKVMKQVVFQKFLKNEEIRNFLLKYPRTSIFVETRRYMFWGNGLDEIDTQLVDPNKWPGKNMLGKILKDVKDELHALDI